MGAFHLVGYYDVVGKQNSSQPVRPIRDRERELISYFIDYLYGCTPFPNQTHTFAPALGEFMVRERESGSGLRMVVVVLCANWHWCGEVGFSC